VGRGNGAARRGFSGRADQSQQGEEGQARAEGKTQAAENRVRFGQAKGDKARRSWRPSGARRELEGKKRD
jgi:hypothetical protein